MADPKEEADKLRAEAKALFAILLVINPNYTSETANRLVDCIIGAAVLEVSAIVQRTEKRPPVDIVDDHG